MTNARNTYAPNVNSQDVLALYDDTVFGGAREGLILTKDCIYSHEISCDPVKVKFGKDSYIRCLKNDIYVNDVLIGHGEVVVTENDVIGISVTDTRP